MSPIIVAVHGPSGAGKTTVVGLLGRSAGWATLDEAFYRLRPIPRLRFSSPADLLDLERRLLDEEARRYVEARQLTAVGRTVVVDTGFADPVEYTAGLLLLGHAAPSTFGAVVRHAKALADRGRLGFADLTVHLEVSRATRARRTGADPRGHPRVFRERHETVGRVVDLRVLPTVRAAVDGHLRVLRASEPARVVAGRVAAWAARTPPLREPTQTLAHWLDRLSELGAGPEAPTSGRSPGSGGTARHRRPSGSARLRRRPRLAAPP